MSKYVLDNEWGTKYPNFKKSEFKCPCGKCNGYGNGIATTLVKTLQETRNKHGKPITITSGYRCPSHNKKVGGSSTSKHKEGLAADFYMDGFNTQANRVKMVNELKKTEYYRYSYCNVNGNYPNMGNVVHIDTKLVDPNEKKGYSGTYPKLPSRGYFYYDYKNKRVVDRGTEVKNVQKLLNWLIDGNLVIDGAFGPACRNATLTYQKMYGLTQDGCFGPACLNKAKTIKK